MQQVNIHQAKTQLSKLIDAVTEGEEIVIAKSGKPLVKLVRIEEADKKPRKPGALKGKIWIANDFDEPLDGEDLALWTKSEIIPENQVK